MILHSQALGPDLPEFPFSDSPATIGNKPCYYSFCLQGNWKTKSKGLPRLSMILNFGSVDIWDHKLLAVDCLVHWKLFPHIFYIYPVDADSTLIHHRKEQDCFLTLPNIIRAEWNCPQLRATEIK